MVLFLALFYKDSAILPDYPIFNLSMPLLPPFPLVYTCAGDTIPVTKILNHFSSKAETPKVKVPPKVTP